MTEGEIPNCEGVVWSTVEPTIVEPLIRHRFTVILCHGRSSTGQTFRDEIFESTSSKRMNLRNHFPSVKWVFPSAGLPFDPRESVQNEAQWFAMTSLKDPNYEQIRQRYGISESMKYLHEIIDQETEAIHGKSSRVILGGISQGAAVAILALLASQHRLNSFVGFCTWLPFSDLLASARDGPQRLDIPPWSSDRRVFQIETGSWESVGPQDFWSSTKAPCFLSHNTDDDIVDVKLGRVLRDELRFLGMKVTWDEHEHGDEELKHWIHEPEGIDNLIKFLERRMSAQTVKD
jgi:lysophospholipase-2